MKRWVITLLGIMIVGGIVAAAGGTYYYFLNKQEQAKPQTATQSSGEGTPSTNVQRQPSFEPLTPEEKSDVLGVIESTDFVEDIPEKYPISLQFFYFDEEGQRIWQDKFLIGKGSVISSGTPDIKLTLHSKYLEGIESQDLCEVIKTANANRDLGFESESSEAKLLWNYKGMMSHRDCFGF